MRSDKAQAIGVGGVLIRFRVANHRSLRAEHELTFVAGDADTEIVRQTGLKSKTGPIGLLPAVGIFGANASGKSNVLSAIQAMRDAVLNSVADWARTDGVPREPFSLDPNCRAQTTLFEVDFLLGRIRHTYGFELSDWRVEAEWLHVYPEGRKQVWFDRQADRGPAEEFRFPNENLRGGKERLAATRPNALFLTVGATLNHKALAEVHEWFRTGIQIVTPANTVAGGRTWQDLLVPHRDPDRAQQITALLRAADLGIVGVQVDESLPSDRQVSLLHRTGAGEPSALDFHTQESLGTHAWFAFLGPLLDALEQGAVLVVDELDSSLHPVLAAEVVHLFLDRGANRNDAQLLFTTHDATLLGHHVVGRRMTRDQVWITSKRSTGETELYPVTDARPRKGDNLELGYLRGRYGGVPRTMAGEVARHLDAG